MPAEPAMPCGTSSLIENALSPTPERGVSIVADFIAVSKESFVRFFGPSATVSVPLADVQMQAETVKPVIGSSTSDGGLVVVPMSACTSDVVTRLAMAVLTDEMPAAAAPLEHVLLLAAAAPLADAAGELVAVADDGDAAAPLALADGDATAPADADAEEDGDASAELEGEADAEAREDGLADDVPTAAGEPLAPVCVPEGPHAIARTRAARVVVVTMMVLMGPRSRRVRATRGICAASVAQLLNVRDVVLDMGRLRTRMFAAALIGYGAVGVLLLAGLAVSLLPMTATIDAIARSSDDVRSTLLTTQNAFDDFSTSLGAARRSAERAADAARSSAAAAKQLADGMAISIFGAQPLIGLSSGFQRQSTDLQSLADELDRLAASLGTNETDVRAIRTEIASLSSRVALISGGSALLLPALFLLIAWLAVPAVLGLWLGVALLRAAPTPGYA